MNNAVAPVSVVVEAGQVYWVDSNLTVWKKDGAQSPIQLSSALTVGVDVDGPWLIHSGACVSRIPAGGGASECIASEQSYGVAIDQGTVYYTSSSGVHRVALVGGAVSIVASNGQQGLALAVDAEHVFWLSNTGTVYRVRKVGGSIDTLGTATANPLVPIGMEVDGTHVYAAFDTLVRIPKDGSGVEETVAPSARDVAVTDEAVFWADADNYRIVKLAK